MFAANSPRRVTPDQATTVQAGAPLAWVGVFADQDPDEIAGLANQLDLSAVQLHGNESVETVAKVRAAVASSCEVWKAFPVIDTIPSRGKAAADRLLLDGARADRTSTERQGGWAISFDWQLVDDYPLKAEVVLAGGLRAENVARAAALQTWALDVSSGVESAPGVKDPTRLVEFFGERRRLPGRGTS